MVHTPEPVAPRDRPWLGRLIRHRWSLLDVSIDEASRIGPHAASHVPAARVFCSMAVPSLVLSSVGRLDLVPWAIFGAFASIYGRDAVPTARVRVQVAVGISLVASIGLGRIVATSANAGWWSVVLGAAVAATAGFISTHRNWRPVGPLFQLIAFSVAAHTPPGSDSNIVAPMAVAAGAVAFSVTIGAVIGRRPRNDDLSQLRLRARGDRPVAGVRAIEYGISAAAAGVVSTLAGYDYAYWAMLGAVVPFMAVERAHRLLRAVHRMTGTMLGLLVAAAILALHPHGLTAILLVITLQAGAELLILRHYGIALVLITPLALVMAQGTDPRPLPAVLFERALQTALGLIVAVLVIAAGSCLARMRWPVAKPVAAGSEPTRPVAARDAGQGSRTMTRREHSQRRRRR